MPMPERRMELLAPAGDMDALRAAVQNGADAVYLGAGGFNARRSAANFEGDALKTAIAYCHIRGVKVHVTLNTLVRQDELAALEDAIGEINLSGADAVIVQDFGVARAVRRIAPEIELHASTQMAVHNAQGVAFLAGQGYHRAVLARELTFEEMAACAKCGIEIEAFVHGALCVACSGQCLMSSLVGGRSGNRGLCAQPCRLPWRLDDREGYLLSTRDLCGIDQLARYREAGVNSLKIEGRLKRAEYVAETVAAYRRALDALYAGATDADLEAEKRELRQMFNRGGFTRGYGPGVSDAELMYSERPNHLGVPVGSCLKSGEVRLDAAVETADALALRRANAEDVPVKLSGAAGEAVKCVAARRGDALYRLVSAEQMRRAQASVNGEHRQVPVTAEAELRVGRPARLTVSDGVHRVAAEGETLAPAANRGLDAARAVAQLKKTGGTAYAMADVALDADADVFCPASTLNALRREALEKLDAARARVDRANSPLAVPKIERVSAGKPRLVAQSGSVEALNRALASGADDAVFLPGDLRPEALEAVRLGDVRLGPGQTLALALPAVLTGAALEAVNAWANRQRFAATWLSNVGQLGLTWPGRRLGDYMLNAGNDLTIAQLSEWGLEGYTPSVELNAGQIAQLGGEAHLVMWGRLPLMRLRHCPLRATRGMRGPHRDCRHCDRCAAGDRLDGRTLVDRKDVAFPLKRVAMPGGCVVQVLNSACLMPLRKRDRLPGAASWRLLLEADAPVEAVVRVYRAALDGADFRTLPEWRAIEALTTTNGHYFRGVL